MAAATAAKPTRWGLSAKLFAVLILLGAVAVLKNAKAMLDDEARRLVVIRQAKSAKEVRAANSGGAYTQKKP